MLKQGHTHGSICEFLRQQEYEIPPAPPHITIVASHRDKPTLLVDCYGEDVPPPRGPTTSKKLPEKVMNEQETLICVSKAYHKATCKRFDCNDGEQVGFVFPCSHSFVKYLSPIQPALAVLGIRLFLVLPNYAVSEVNPMTDAQVDSRQLAMVRRFR